MRPLFNSLQWKNNPLTTQAAARHGNIWDIMTVRSCSKATRQRIHRKAKNSSLSFLTADSNIYGSNPFQPVPQKRCVLGHPCGAWTHLCLGSQALSQCLSGPSLSMPHLTPQLRKALSVPPVHCLWWCSRFITCPGIMESRLESNIPGKVKVLLSCAKE